MAMDELALITASIIINTKAIIFKIEDTPYVALIYANTESSNR